MKKSTFDLDLAVQINDGLTQTSGDGVALAFDTKYGIMFCAYMPGKHGSYGESRGKIALSYFPASQPTNIKFIDITEGRAEYVPNVISLGDGKVRIFYEVDSIAEGDHQTCYKDFDYLSGELTEEKVVKIKLDDGSIVDLCQSVEFAYLEARGFFNHQHVKTEQIVSAAQTPFKGEDGYWYTAISTYLSEVILCRSNDDLATLEPFAICPHQTQYEFDYRYLDGKIHAIFRTNRDVDAISYTTSDDNGKTWSEPVHFAESIQCRPKIIVHNGHILMSYNYYCDDTGNRPEIQQGRTAVRLCYGENPDPNKNVCVADLYSKYGIVNVCLVDVMGDVYLGYSSSVLALEYHNGNSKVRGKDAIRYIKLGDLSPKE